jgi:2-hydroxychromene-2-carboxylate isomerase
MGQAAAERGKGLAFLYEVSAIIWSGRTKDWHLGDHLQRATERAGLNFAELEAAVAADPQGLDARIEANQEAQRVGGHYGVPLMVFEGEPFFGQDRFDQLKWRMEQKGLARRAPIARTADPQRAKA